RRHTTSVNGRFARGASDPGSDGIEGAPPEPLPAWMARRLAALPAIDRPETPRGAISPFLAATTLGDLLVLTEDDTLTESAWLVNWEVTANLANRCLALAPVPLPVVPLGF
ncbi:MAG: hypothetical protein KDE28_28560, partial [Anaerolineales bacterium]|nr:hypothetical protein [Anaerolineales bacterium]